MEAINFFPIITGQFEKILSLINNNDYFMESTHETREEENMPFKKSFRFIVGKYFFHLSYLFRQPNIEFGFDPKWEKSIFVTANKNFDNKLLQNKREAGFENWVEFKIVKDKIIAFKDNSVDCANTISTFNELLEMAK